MRSHLLVTLATLVAAAAPTLAQAQAGTPGPPKHYGKSQQPDADEVESYLAELTAETQATP